MVPKPGSTQELPELTSGHNDGPQFSASLSTRPLTSHLLVDFSKSSEEFLFLPLVAQFKVHLMNTPSDELPPKGGSAFRPVIMPCFRRLSIRTI